MERIAVIAITEGGRKLGKALVRAFSGKARLYFYAPGSYLKDSVSEIFDKSKFDCLIFIMALGVVIRLLAPHLKDKYRDPAIVVVDEANRFSISALSGHEGGANRLAIEVGNILDAEPVITTASESKKDIIIGLGCRRGIRSEEVINGIKYAAAKTGCSLDKVRYIATIDLKSNESGLREACLGLGIPLRVISLGLIKNFKGAYQRSSFVKKSIGVGGVSEPCALLAGRKTKLILPKIKLRGLTLAVARED